MISSKESVCSSCLTIKWTDKDKKEFQDIEKGLHDCTCANAVDGGHEMLPAGTLIHLVPISSGNNPKYSLEVVEEDKFNNINVCSNMVTDHMPPQYIKSLKIVNQKWKEQDIKNHNRQIDI